MNVNESDVMCESYLNADQEPRRARRVDLINYGIKVICKLYKFQCSFVINMLKCGYSEKATKFEKLFHLKFDAT